ALLDRIENKIGGHYFRQRCRAPLHVLVFGIQHLAFGSFEHECRAGHSEGGHNRFAGTHRDCSGCDAQPAAAPTTEISREHYSPLTSSLRHDDAGNRAKSTVLWSLG